MLFTIVLSCQQRISQISFGFFFTLECPKAVNTDIIMEHSQNICSHMNMVM